MTLCTARVQRGITARAVIIVTIAVLMGVTSLTGAGVAGPNTFSRGHGEGVQPVHR